jgi:transcriptional regulator with XRE-family HTH domain
MPPEDEDDREDRDEKGNTDLGARIRRFRREHELNLTQLAEQAGVSKGYLSILENDPETRRPSAQTLYALAKALGVTMSDLMGRKVLPAAAIEVPDSLRKFAKEEDLPEADVRMLASIQFRGEQPRTKERWRYIYTAIRTSTAIDQPPPSP